MELFTFTRGNSAGPSKPVRSWAKVGSMKQRKIEITGRTRPQPGSLRIMATWVKSVRETCKKATRQ